MCVSSTRLRVTGAVTDVGAGWWARRVGGPAAAHAAAILPAAAVPATRAAAWLTSMARLICCADWQCIPLPDLRAPSFTYPPPRVRASTDAEMLKQEGADLPHDTDAGKASTLCIAMHAVAAPQ